MKLPGFGVEPTSGQFYPKEIVPDNQPAVYAPMSAAQKDWEPEGDASAGLLWQLVAKLTTWFLYERSFRICRNAIFGKRYLLITGIRNLGDNHKSKIRALWQHLNMPVGLQYAAEQLLNDWSPVFFGYEENGASSLLKFYVETAKPGDLPHCGPPILLYQGFKWNPCEPSNAVLSKYHLYPGLTSADIFDRINEIYEQCVNRESLEIVRGMISLALQRVGVERLKYMEVTEQGSLRKSFAVNLYDADLRLLDVAEFVGNIGQAFSISQVDLESLIRPHHKRPLGCVAGGSHRAGETFLNLYYGIGPRQGLGGQI